ncbi:MAG: GNAT family N-acetyltransferase [Deltaproteobacteria bacterium]
MRTEVIEAEGDFLSLGREWDRLFEEAGQDNFFLGWPWIKTWWECFGRSMQPRIITVRGSSGRLEGAAALAIRQRRMAGIAVKCVELIGSGSEVTPDHLGFISLPGIRDGFARTVFSELRKRSREWDMIRLTDLQDDEAVRCAASRAFGTQAEAVQRGICPFIELPSSWEIYSGSLARRVRYNINRQERELGKRFRVDFSLCRDRDQLGPLMEKFEAAHRQRMAAKGKNGLQASLDPLFWHFHRQVADEAFDRGQLLFGAVTLDGELAACQYGFCCGKRFLFYQSGLDPRFEEFSVGFLLTAFMVRELIGRGFAEYDFLRGDERYKFFFTKSIRPNTEIIVRNKNLKTFIVSGLSFPRAALKKLIMH